jgi:hypothetical protein
MLNLNSREYSIILKKRAEEVADLIASEGFGSGLTFAESTVERVWNDLEEIVNEIREKRKQKE